MNKNTSNKSKKLHSNGYNELKEGIKAIKMKADATSSTVNIANQGKEPISTSTTGLNIGNAKKCERKLNGRLFQKGNTEGSKLKGKPKRKTVLKSIVKAMSERAVMNGAIRKEGEKLGVDFSKGLEQFLDDISLIIAKGIKSKNPITQTYWVTQILPYTMPKLNKNENTNKNLTVHISKSGKKVKEIDLTEVRQSSEEAEQDAKTE